MRFRTAIVIPASVKSIGKEVFAGYYYMNGEQMRTLGIYFLGDAPSFFGTQNANCSFSSSWTLFYREGTSGWTAGTYEGYQTCLWDGVSRWDNMTHGQFRWDMERYWGMNPETGWFSISGDFSDGARVVAAMYDESGRMTGVRVFCAEQPAGALDLTKTCRLFLLDGEGLPLLPVMTPEGLLDA